MLTMRNGKVADRKMTVMTEEGLAELHERIRTLESACEAALKFVNRVRGTTWYARNEEAKDVVEQLEKVIKHG